MKRILTFLLFCQLNFVYAQNAAINSDGSAAHSSAILDVKATDKGVLVPRMTQAQRNAIATPATGLLIYQTDATAGFYYYNGSAWTAVSGWGLTGNSGTNPTTNFIGTTDAQPLFFKANNQLAGRIDIKQGLIIMMLMHFTALRQGKSIHQDMTILFRAIVQDMPTQQDTSTIF
jgi:hypothetical protein